MKDRVALIQERQGIIDSIREVEANPNTFALAQDLGIDNALFEDQDRLQKRRLVLLKDLSIVNEKLGSEPDSRHPLYE